MSIKKNIFAPSTTGRGAMRRAAMLLLVMMLTTATAWAQTTITPTTPSQDGDGYYLIGTAAELYGFAELVNNGNATANAKLTADIVVNENVLDANGEANTGDFVQWTPIGNNFFEDKVYSGTFDGQGHTISGLYVSGNGWFVGFVGQVSGTAVVKNLGIVDSYFSSSNNHLGSIVGGVAEKSSVTIANVYSTSTVKGDNFIGGLVGGDGNGSVTIINSYFAGKTSTGWSYDTHHDDLVAGYFDRSTLTVCNAFVLGTSQYGTSVTAEQLSDGTVAAALHYYQDALADGSMFGVSDGKTAFSGSLDGVSVTTADITLHTFDGDATAYSSKYIVGNTTPLPLNVVRDGYQFFGWYDNADFEGNAVTQISSSETADKEYWAKFERGHAVSFVLNGGTIQSGAIDHYIEGETTMLPTMVFKDGASFEGWYTTENYTGDRYYAIPATATEDMTFYAKWGAEKTTFYLMQGSPEPVNILYEGENIVWLNKTTSQINDYYFDGYHVQDNQGNLWGGDGTVVNVPYTGGESTFGLNASVFSVPQSGFYVFTLTDMGDESWFMSILKSMLNCDVASIPTQVYTGSAIEPDVTVKDGETTLDLDEDYEVTYSNNVNAGTATVTITGKGNYSGETAATFTIVNPVTTSYVDATGTLHDGVEAVPLDNTMTTLAEGWYVVNENVDYTGKITLGGDVNIILANGKTMTVTNTGTGNEDFAIYGDSGSLHIYGQSQGTGALTATANSSVAIKLDDYITIDGGIVNATSTGDVGIYGIDGVTINGGTVNANGIYADGDITINGGKVTNNSDPGIRSNNGTIILGLSNATDYITAESYSGAVKIADGQTLVDDGGNIWSGTLDNDQIENGINDRTLRPVMGVVLTKDGFGNISAEFNGTSLETMSIPVDITVNSVTLNRTFTFRKCATLMLPFSLGDGQSLNGGTLYKFDGVNNGEGDWVATLSEFTSPLKANTPYLIEPNGHMTDDKITFDLNGGTVTLNTTTAGEDSNEKDDLWDFIGTYSYIKWTSDTGDQDYSAEREAEIGKVYGFAAVEKAGIHVGDFVRVASGAKIRPMCAYLKWKGSIPNNARALTRAATNDDTELPQRITVKLVSASGETTAIGTLDTTTGEVSFDSEAWYTLDGVRLSGKPTKKGLYINNGKKIVIR